MTASADTPLLELSARDLAAAVRARTVSAREVLDAHFARIDDVNPAVNAVVTQARTMAYETAARADELTAVTPADELPPLHGVPMTHKDTHATKGIRTTSGSPVHANLVPDHDDLVVARFKAAGVVSTGKNNVPEFAAGSHSFNELFGTTHNPYDRTRSAGGSSGGAAAAIAARIQPLGDGSDMGGSLRNPAAFCNVVGFRPSAGVVPLAPTRNAWAWLGRTGPIARSVDDVVLAMSVLAGPDPRVPLACPVGREQFRALAAEDPAELGSRPLAGVRIGVSTDFGLGVPVEQEILDVLAAQARVLEELGAVVEEAVPDLRDADEVFDTTRAFDMATDLRTVVAEHRQQVKPEVIWNVERGLALTAGQLMDAALARTRLHEAVRGFFQAYDVLLLPTTQVLPFPADERWPRSVAGVPMETYVEWMRSASLISATGCPAVSVPGGFSPGGLPVGLQLVAADGCDVELLRVARAYDAATRHADVAPRL
ncbi:amidase [Kocuria dechangensis]|uniref:Amidase n=1 Tax=Kocuria dechangensis TaxID=1176249 RepID=A0A917GI88_9MICC|nr:amidase [Kocuria dechangensis]GGG46925.1 amidase [Kocuria dechangensis]